MKKRGFIALAALTLLLSGAAPAQQRRHPTRYRFEATAFCADGTTASGLETHRGHVAADPRILPLGTRVRVLDAGPYSGTYVVADTGSKVVGRHIDIYVPNRPAAKRFGKRMVRVRVLKWGTWS